MPLASVNVYDLRQRPVYVTIIPVVPILPTYFHRLSPHSHRPRTTHGSHTHRPTSSHSVYLHPVPVLLFVPAKHIDDALVCNIVPTDDLLRRGSRCSSSHVHSPFTLWIPLIAEPADLRYLPSSYWSHMIYILTHVGWTTVDCSSSDLRRAMAYLSDDFFIGSSVRYVACIPSRNVFHCPRPSVSTVRHGPVTPFSSSEA